MRRLTDARARQSQLVTTYGVGSLVPGGRPELHDLRTGRVGRAEVAPPVEEPRLARSLGVHTSGLPRAEATRRRPVVRFPTFHYCPDCRRLDSLLGVRRHEMECPDCVRDLTPSRFVACCENGHIEDFPYFQWVHRGERRRHLEGGDEHRMTLMTRGASSSLADIIVSCSCGVRPRDLDGSFTRNAVAEIKSCGGERPWLPGAEPEICDKPLRALQRGSSNVWFGAVRSSISIPPWSSPNARFVTRHWDVFQHQTDEQIRDAAVGAAARDRTIDVEGVLQVARQRRGVDDAQFRPRLSCAPRSTSHCATETTAARRTHSMCPGRGRSIHLRGRGSGVEGHRFREVRALHGFSRVTPTPTDLRCAPSRLLERTAHELAPRHGGPRRRHLRTA